MTVSVAKVNNLKLIKEENISLAAQTFELQSPRMKECLSQLWHALLSWADIHQVVLSLFSQLAKLFIGKLTVKD
jgi:hypothetical protein